MSTLYMKASEETVGKYVIFSGDPWRVNVLKKYLDDPVDVAFSREFHTVTGTYRVVKITATSTGIESTCTFSEISGSCSLAFATSATTKSL